MEDRSSAVTLSDRNGCRRGCSNSNILDGSVPVVPPHAHVGRGKLTVDSCRRSTPAHLVAKIDVPKTLDGLLVTRRVVPCTIKHPIETCSTKQYSTGLNFSGHATTVGSVVVFPRLIDTCVAMTGGGCVGLRTEHHREPHSNSPDLRRRWIRHTSYRQR